LRNPSAFAKLLSCLASADSAQNKSISFKKIPPRSYPKTLRRYRFSENHHGKGHVNQSGENNMRTFVANNQASEVLQPSVGAFNNPAVAVTPQMPPILMRRFGIILSSRDDGQHAATFDQLSCFIAVVAFVRNQAFWLNFLTGNFQRIQSRLKEFNFRGRSRLNMQSNRDSLPVYHQHQLRAFASFGLADEFAPFLALLNVPSTKHSSQRRRLLLSSSAKNVRQSFSNNPFSAQSFNLRWTVLLAPYLFGKAAQGEPVQRIHKIPSKHLRSSAEGRPPLRSFLFLGRLRTGTTNLTFSHWTSVNPSQLMFSPSLSLLTYENILALGVVFTLVFFEFLSSFSFGITSIIPIRHKSRLAH